METKTYYAADMPTAMEQIKRELGVDAIIIKSRKIKQKYGPLKLLRRDMYEVVVSCEPDNTLPPARAGFNMDARLRIQQAKAALSQPAAARDPKEVKQEEAAARKAELAQLADELLPKKHDEQAAGSKASDTAPEEVRDIQPERFAQLLELNVSRQETSEEHEGMLRVLSAKEVEESPASVSSSTKLGAYAAAMAAKTARVIRREDAANLKEIQEAKPEKEPERATAAEEAPEEAEEEIVPAAKAPAQQAQPAAQQDDNAMARLEALESMMRELKTKMIEDAEKAAKQQPVKQQEARRPAAQYASIETLLNMLADQDVDQNALRAIEADAKQRMLNDKLEARDAVEQALTALLGKPSCMKALPKNRKKRSPRCILFVGPTGVGKTTTLVKLAATCVFERRAKVAIINADVFRVGAQDQLSAYARILNVPISTIYETGELAEAVRQYADHDFIFIDTSGKAPHDPDYQAELQRILASGLISEIYLAASSTSSGRVCRQLAHEYDALGEYRIIVTKLDESNSYGALVNLRYASGRPLSYITTGQNVPDDIKRAEPKDIIEAILG